MELREIKKRIGCSEQLFGVTRFTYAEGKAKGTDAVEVRTGAGLRYIVLPDRGMDIGLAEYRGLPFAHISPVGVVAPQYYEPQGDEWLRSFTAGLLTTCGLDQVGDPCEAGGLHGRIANTPATEVCACTEETEDGCVMAVSGVVRQAKEAVQNLTLRRTVRSRVGENTMEIQDTVTNEGYVPSPFMLLYHMNFGYPFLDEEFSLEIPHSAISSMYEGREAELAKALQAEEPRAGYAENVFYLEVEPNEKGQGVILAHGREYDIRITFPAQQLPRVAVWKQMGCGDYVMAVEPCNNWIRGQGWERENGTLQYLQGGESRRLSITLAIEPHGAE